MQLQAFSVFDSKAQLFLQPFYSQTVGTALRSFAMAANDAQHQFHLHAGDYSLFHLGAFNQDTAQFTALAAPINLGLAITLVEELASDDADPIQSIG